MVAGRRQAVDSVPIKANASLDSMIEREVLQDISDFANELDQNAEQLKKGLVAKTNPYNKTHYNPSDPDAKIKYSRTGYWYIG